MKLEKLTKISEIEEFLGGSQPVLFTVADSKDKIYVWIEDQLKRLRYKHLIKRERGVVIKLLRKISGYSRQQITRLIKQYMTTGCVVRRQKTVRGFEQKYTVEDIKLLAKVDELHQTPNGAAIKKICERARDVYNDKNYKRLADISISHLYNLRGSKKYKQHRTVFEKTKSNPKSIPIGERRKPRHYDQPGYIRIDTVHQGDSDGAKGVYHINAVDEVTQFECVATVEKISEAYLLPVIQIMLESFPFKIKGFHSDNGSEYVNINVANLLNKLKIEFTKSRPRRSNDNGLVETKNGAVVRKIFGYSHIKQRWAETINEFNAKYLNPYLNYHRPCYFPETKINEKGKEVKTYLYKDMMTPYEKLKSLPNSDQYLKANMSFKKLDAILMKMTDNEAAERLNQERSALFKHIHEQDRVYA